MIDRSDDVDLSHRCEKTENSLRFVVSECNTVDTVDEKVDGRTISLQSE